MQFDRDPGNVMGDLELTHLIEDFDDTMRSTGTSSPKHVELHIKNILARQKDIKSRYPGISSTLDYSAATIHLHHRLLQAIHPPDPTTLIQAVCTVKEHIDSLLSRDSATLLHLPIFDWASLLETLVVMVHLARPYPPASTIDVLEAGTIASMLQPETLLAALLAQLDRANTRNELFPHSEWILLAFRMVCTRLTQRLASDQRGNLALGGFRPVNDVVESAPGLLDVNADAFEEFGNGVMDDAFWKAFSRSAVGGDQ